MTSSSSDIEKVLRILQQSLEESQNDNMTLQGQIDELKEQSREHCKDNDYLRNKIAGIQQDNSIYNNTQSRLETQLYAQEQDMTDLRKQVQHLTKAKNDAEHKLQLELTAFETDRTAWQQKEVDMFNQIRTLSTGGEPRTPRTPHRRSASVLTPFGFPTLKNIGEEDNTPTLTHSSSTSYLPKRNSRLMDEMDSDSDYESTTPKLATIDSSFARENKISQRTIKAQDKLILDLKLELDQQKSIIQDHETQAQQQSLRVQHLEQEISNVKQVNQSLMEDNESYQILLHEKTISGEFMTNPIMQVESINGIMKNSTSTNTNGSGGLNLADELNQANDFEATQKVDKIVQKLTDEVKILQDTNRALQLYMNKILMKIIDNKQLEDVLSIDQPKTVTEPSSSTSVSSSSHLKPPPQTSGPGPTPTRTLSSTLLSKTTASRQQRRRTISYWGSKTPTDSDTLPAVPESTLTDRDNRRHTAMPTKESTKETNGGGWTKALRRMSIGWSASQTVQEDDTSEDPTRHLQPTMSRSGSSTTSLRASNELANIQEE